MAKVNASPKKKVQAKMNTSGQLMGPPADPSTSAPRKFSGFTGEIPHLRSCGFLFRDALMILSLFMYLFCFSYIILFICQYWIYFENCSLTGGWDCGRDKKMEKRKPSLLHSTVVLLSVKWLPIKKVNKKKRCTDGSAGDGLAWLSS